MAQPNTVGGQSTSFKTNVNRAKTKRWVEAKSYSYDGDDWGDVDDYDEYGGYDEPEPQPAPKPTGLRQRGQSASQPSQDVYRSQQGVYQASVDHGGQAYGNIGGAPTGQQHPSGGSVTSTRPQNLPEMARSNSFDRGDEKRVFSAGGPQQTMTPATAGLYPTSSNDRDRSTAAQDFQSDQSFPPNPTQAPQSPGRPPLQIPAGQSVESQSKCAEQIHSPGGNYRGGPHPDRSRHPNIGARSQSMASDNSLVDFHDRRDFSPSAMPPPLQTRGSPSPHGVGLHHPPRKSSLSQDNPLPISPGLPMPVPAGAIGFSPLPRERAGSISDNALPLVRPADIYRRMHEEKEKERQSQESSRPSMDVIKGRSNERSNLEGNRESDSSQRLKPTLDPVAERKGDYGLEGITGNDTAENVEKRPTTSKRFEMKKPSSTDVQGPKSSLQPMLPEVTRISGFGDSFMGPDHNFGDLSQPLRPDESALQLESQTPVQSRQTSNLQHQPSLGFTSAVHQAFDKAEEQVPPTPSSTAGSTIGRSTSGGTSVVSPVMSRGPGVTQDHNVFVPVDDVTSTATEGLDINSSRRLSSDSAGTLTHFARKPSPTQVIAQSVEKSPPLFVPGHRRNMSTPSPDNSPARTPTVDVNKQLRQPQELELAVSTPTDTYNSASSSLQESPLIQSPINTSIHAYQNKTQQDTMPTVNMESGSTQSPVAPAPIFLRNRTDSASSNRIRNLADKFESNSRPGSAHSTTPRASIVGGNVSKSNDLGPTRPVNDRMESFRPHLPGGWESSASVVPLAKSTEHKTHDSKRSLEQSSALASAPPFSAPGRASDNESIPFAGDSLSPISQIKDTSDNAFNAVAAAGSALAGALAAAVGIEHHERPSDSAVEKSHSEEQLYESTTSTIAASRDRTASVNTVVNPEASKSHMLRTADDEASNAAPTPSGGSALRYHDQQSATSEYFPEATSASSTYSPAAASSAPIWAKPFDRDAGPTDTRHPPTLQTLDTGVGSDQYESDRLSREIAMNLNANLASEPTTAGSDLPAKDPSRLSTNQNEKRRDRESGVLPREYESYWNDEDSEDGFSVGSGEREDAKTAQRQQDVAIVDQHVGANNTQESALSTDADQVQPSQGKHHVLPHRFSWEQPSQELSVTANDPVQEPNQFPQADFLESSIYPERGSFQPKQSIRSVEPDATPMVLSSVQPGIEESQGSSVDVQEDSNMADTEDILLHQREAKSTDQNLPSYIGGLEVVTPLTEKESIDSLEPQKADNDRDPSPPAPPLHQGPRQEMELPAEITSTMKARNGELPPLPPPAPPMNSQPKIPAFREILALKTPADRIRAYNETRDQFANANTGLAHWLSVTINESPEHADLLSQNGRVGTGFQGHKPSPSRSKLGNILTTGGPQGSTPEGAISQGFSPLGNSSGKISGQQVQAKSKELLHTAGVFGGKANVAAKGLFSKGRSKLQSSGGSKKAPMFATSPDPVFRGMQSARETKEAPLTELQARALSHESSSTSSDFAPASSLDVERNTPSTESFTQSQLGDDERSEESASEIKAHSPRTSSLFIENNAKSPRRSQVGQANPATIGDAAPVFLQQTPSADSHDPTPREIQSPRSTTSSNKTPTQATFDLYEDMPSVPYTYEQTESPIEARSIIGSKVHMIKNTMRPPNKIKEVIPRPFSPPKSRYSIRLLPDAEYPAESYHQRVPKQAPSPSFSDESEGTFHTAGSGRALANTQSPRLMTSQASKTRSALDSQTSRELDRPLGLVAGRASSPERSSNARLDSSTLRASRAFSPIDESQNPLRMSEDEPWRDPSMNSTPRNINPDRPPSPRSPEPLSIPDEPDQRGRSAGPVHHGINHDFAPETSVERARRRSPSFSRPSLTDRSSGDSRRPFHEPDIQDHPAYRHGIPTSKDADFPTHLYPPQASREEALLPRQQAIEYQLEGVRPPPVSPSDGKARSERSSRSSAFFKALATPSKSPSKPSSPVISNATESHHYIPPAVISNGSDMKNNRSSIFRSITGNARSGSSSPYSKEISTTKTVTHPSVPLSISSGLRSQFEDDSPPRASKGITSRLSKRMQRASTSAKPARTDQDDSKKKRFSAIGSLFGRSNQKRQSTAEHTQMPPRQERMPSQQDRSLDPYNLPSPMSQKIFGLDEPGNASAQPPGEGYYAPFRCNTIQSPGHVPPAASHRRRPSPETPAYMQDSALRNPTSTKPQAPPPTVQRASATFPQTNTQHSHSESFAPRHLPPTDLSSGSAWTHFSTQGRSRNRQSHQLNTASTPPSNKPPPAPPTTSAPSLFTNLNLARNDSPPPPPPPPKDDWHRSQPRDSVQGPITSVPASHHQFQSMTGVRANFPTGSSPRPSKSNRQSLPVLQTNYHHPPATNKGTDPRAKPGPEEKRRSRQQEIETGHLSASGASGSAGAARERGRGEKEEDVVMSATSFPGQEWMPEFVGWEGE